MKRKALVALMLGALMAASVVGTGGTAVAGKKKKAKGPVVVGTDVAGDWGQAVDPQIAPVGDALGQDLTEASITMGDGTIDFIIKLNSLPPTGGTPEFSRYSWNFTIGKEALELDGKFTNYSRGACDPTAGTCPPPRDPGSTPFSLRGNCGVTPVGTVQLTTCEELALISATFDAAAGTITIPVPIEALKAKPGTKIVPSAGIFGGTISAAPSAFLTNGTMPMDTMVVTKTFVVPK